MASSRASEEGQETSWQVSPMLLPAFCIYLQHALPPGCYIFCNTIQLCSRRTVFFECLLLATNDCCIAMTSVMKVHHLHDGMCISEAFACMSLPLLYISKIYA